MQLIKITTTPIKYEFSTENARLEISQENVHADISKSGGTWDVRRRTPKIRVDSFEYRSSVGSKSIRTYMREAAQRGREAAMEATANYADFGNKILHIERGANIPDTAFSKYFQNATKGQLMLIPTSPIDISWTEGELDMNYLPVKLKFDWSPGKVKLNYVPGSFKINITQMPSISFEYLGKPIYVPPSAAPDFEAIA